MFYSTIIVEYEKELLTISKKHVFCRYPRAHASNFGLTFNLIAETAKANNENHSLRMRSVSLVGSCRLRWRRRWLDHSDTYPNADTHSDADAYPHAYSDTHTDADALRTGLGTGHDSGADGDLHG